MCNHECSSDGSSEAVNNGLSLRKVDEEFYKGFGSFFLKKINGVKDFVHSLGIAGLACMLFAGTAMAVDVNPTILPTGYTSVSGDVQFSQVNNTLNVTTQANKSIANYNTFNLSSDAIVNFNLPGSEAAILNRVTGGVASEIFGTINTPNGGQVFLVNPSGVLFGATAQVNVGSLLASTLDITDQDFLSGNYVFNQGQNPSELVNNLGNITVSDGGFALLLGGAVSNGGTITAPNGSLQLAVGSTISVPTSGGVVLEVVVTDELSEAVSGVQNAILNTGTLSAHGGLLNLVAELDSALYNSVINNEGIIQANTVQDNNGSISLVARINSESPVQSSVVNVGSLSSTDSLLIESDVFTQLAEGSLNGNDGSVTLNINELFLSSGQSPNVLGSGELIFSTLSPGLSVQLGDSESDGTFTVEQEFRGLLLNQEHFDSISSNFEEVIVSSINGSVLIEDISLDHHLFIRGGSINLNGDASNSLDTVLSANNSLSIKGGYFLGSAEGASLTLESAGFIDLDGAEVNLNDGDFVARFIEMISEDGEATGEGDFRLFD